MIEEITEDEKIALGISKPEPSSSSMPASEKASTHEAKDDQEPQTGEQPPSSLPVPSETPSSVPLPRSESPRSATASEIESGAGESQTGNSFVLVDDSTSPGEPAQVATAPTVEESWVDEHEDEHEAEEEKEQEEIKEEIKEEIVPEPEAPTPITISEEGSVATEAAVIESAPQEEHVHAASAEE